MPELPDTLMRQQIVVGLGVLGIAPFAIATFWPDAATGQTAFSLYSLAIFCFLCGSWWSTALVAPSVPETKRILVIVASNALVLVALTLTFLWMALGLGEAPLGMAALYGVLVSGEWRLPVFRQQPFYYRAMRAGVSSVVAVLHVIAWFRWASIPSG